jgi:hypothetical protein
MVEISWKSFLEVNPKNKYLAQVSFIERKSVWSFFSFLMQARKVQVQLKTTKGLVGYSMRMEIFSKTGGVLSVWENESALVDGFAHAGQHSVAMKKFKPMMKSYKVIKWEISGANVPLKWEEVLKKSQNLST